MKREDQRDAMAAAQGGIARAAARAEAFAQKADKDGQAAQAALLRALCESQKVQAARLLNLARGKIGDHAANLDEALGSGMERLASALDEAASLLAAADQKIAARALRQSAGINRALAALGAGEQGAASYALCGICGHVQPGEPPERCPVCGAIRDKFRQVA